MSNVVGESGGSDSVCDSCCLSRFVDGGGHVLLVCSMGRWLMLVGMVLVLL